VRLFANGFFTVPSSIEATTTNAYFFSLITKMFKLQSFYLCFFESFGKSSNLVGMHMSLPQEIVVYLLKLPLKNN
jgi:hypothetical protein